MQESVTNLDWSVKQEEGRVRVKGTEKLHTDGDIKTGF